MWRTFDAFVKWKAVGPLGVSKDFMMIRVSVKQEFGANRKIVTGRLFDDVFSSEAASGVLTDFGVAFELGSIEDGEPLFDLVLVDSRRSIVASCVTEEEVTEYVGDSANYLELGEALDVGCEEATGWSVQKVLPEENPYAAPGVSTYCIPEGAYNFQRLHNEVSRRGHVTC
jgi:hypothetical protein